MTKLINEFYYMVDDWASQQYESSGEAKDLLVRKSELEQEIVRRLGGDGQDMMETLAGLNLKLETIHDEALFRASMELGAKIARPRRGAWTAAVPGDACTSGSGLTG